MVPSELTRINLAKGRMPLVSPGLGEALRSTGCQGLFTRAAWGRGSQAGNEKHYQADAGENLTGLHRSLSPVLIDIGAVAHHPEVELARNDGFGRI